MAKRIALVGIMIAQALVLAFLERLIPLNFGIPGLKLGLANIITISALYILGPTYAITIQIGRILLTGLMFGNGVSIIYSLSGGILSVLVMVLIFKTDKPKLSIIGISAIAAIFHNVGQILIASLMVKSLNIAYYLPVLMIFGIATGIFVGLVSKYLVKAINKLKIDSFTNK